MGSGCQFIDDEPPVAGDEQLDRQQTDHIQRLEDVPAQSAGCGFQCGRDASRRHSHIQDVVGMDILEHRERCELSIHRPGSHHADLLSEIDKGLVDAFGAR